MMRLDRLRAGINGAVGAVIDGPYVLFLSIFLAVLFHQTCMSLFLHPFYSDLIHLTSNYQNSSESSPSFMSTIFRRFASSATTAASAASSAPKFVCLLYDRTDY
jgi:hypothetical protein